MEIFSSDKMLNYKLGGKNIQLKGQILIKWDFLISYCNENHIYFICRCDGKQITGNESIGAWRYNYDKLTPLIYENFEDALIRLIMGFTGRQKDEILF